ncbi:MAG TPA: hypothetical protein DEG79_07165 [Hyphomonas sp.]|nr:hypothetical protein [Hyphomonas sp.]
MLYQFIKTITASKHAAQDMAFQWIERSNSVSLHGAVECLYRTGPKLLARRDYRLLKQRPAGTEWITLATTQFI